MAHFCHALGCERRCDPTMLMCRTHWFRVPSELRTEVKAAYQPGQCTGNVRPSSAWLAAARAAINAVGAPLVTD